MLLVLSGLPGTGKTTLSRPLAARLGAALVRVDAIETALLRTGTTTPEGLGPAGYVVAHEVAAACLAVGTPVVVDAVNPAPQARAGWVGLAERAGVRLVVVEVHLPDEAEHRRRVEARRPDLEGQRVPTWDEVAARDYVLWDEARDGRRLRVDGTDADAAVDAVLAHVAPST